MKLNDQDKQILFDCESNCGKQFPICKITDCDRFKPMKSVLRKLWARENENAED